MASTSTIQCLTGAAGGTETECDNSGTKNLRFKMAEDTTNDLVAPMVKPSAGTNWSWRKNTALKFTLAPAGAITNLRWFGPGGDLATGVSLYAKVGAYVQPTNEGEVSGMTKCTAAVYISTSPMPVESGTVLTATTGYGTQTSASKYTILQVGVTSSASRGTAGPGTCTYRFDES